MKTKLILAGVLALGAVGSGGYVLGQSKGRTDALMTSYQIARSRFADYTLNSTMAGMAEGSEKTKYVAATNKLAGAPKALAAAMTKGVKDTGVTSTILGAEIASYERKKFSAQSAPQASQIANETTAELLIIQTAQNQRIIELLEEMNAKKK